MRVSAPERAGIEYPSLMELVTQVLATTNEISLKGGNRKWFERTLTDNVRRALEDLPVAAITRPAWRVLISFTKPVPLSRRARWHTVFGIGAIMAVEHAGLTIDSCRQASGPRLDVWTPLTSPSVACAPTSHSR